MSLKIEVTPYGCFVDNGQCIKNVPLQQLVSVFSDKNKSITTPFLPLNCIQLLQLNPHSYILAMEFPPRICKVQYSGGDGSLDRELRGTHRPFPRDEEEDENVYVQDENVYVRPNVDVTVAIPPQGLVELGETLQPPQALPRMALERRQGAWEDVPLFTEGISALLRGDLTDTNGNTFTVGALEQMVAAQQTAMTTMTATVFAQQAPPEYKKPGAGIFSFTIPTPYLINFAVLGKEGDSYFIRADYVYASPTKLESLTDKLYLCPLGNVHRSGEVCWGSQGKLSGFQSLMALSSFPDRYLTSTFNNDLDHDTWSVPTQMGRMSATTLNLFNQLHGMATFPAELLVRGIPYNQVLAELRSDFECN